MPVAGRLRFLFFAAIFFLFSANNAFARVNLAVMGIGQLSAREFRAEDQPLKIKDRAKLSYGGALNLEFRFDHKWSLEIGGTYLQRKSQVPTAITIGSTQLDTGGNTITTYWAIPTVAIRVWWETFFISFGGYYGYAIGDVDIDTNLNGASASTTIAYEDTSLEDQDYGALFSAGWNLADNWIRIEFRYLMGLADASTVQNVDMKYQDAQVLLGIVF